MTTNMPVFPRHGVSREELEAYFPKNWTSLLPTELTARKTQASAILENKKFDEKRMKQLYNCNDPNDDLKVLWTPRQLIIATEVTSKYDVKKLYDLKNTNDAKRVLYLVILVEKYKPLLKDLLDAGEYFKQYPEDVKDTAIVYLALFDILCRENGATLEKQMKMSVRREYKNSGLKVVYMQVEKEKNHYYEEVYRRLHKSGVRSVYQLLPNVIPITLNLEHPKKLDIWINNNNNLETWSEDTDLLKKAGFNEYGIISNKAVIFNKIEALPYFYELNILKYTDFMTSFYYINNIFIPTDRNYCLGMADLVSQLIKLDIHEGTIIQTHILSISATAYFAYLLSMVFSPPLKLKVYGADKMKESFESYFSLLQLKNVTVFKERFYIVNPRHKDIAKTTSVLVNPETTFDSSVNIIDEAMNRGYDIVYLQSTFNMMCENNVRSPDFSTQYALDLKNLAKRNIQRAFSIPKVKFIVYQSFDRKETPKDNLGLHVINYETECSCTSLMTVTADINATEIEDTNYYYCRKLELYFRQGNTVKHDVSSEVWGSDPPFVSIFYRTDPILSDTVTTDEESEEALKKKSISILNITRVRSTSGSSSTHRIAQPHEKSQTKTKPLNIVTVLPPKRTPVNSQSDQNEPSQKTQKDSFGVIPRQKFLKTGIHSTIRRLKVLRNEVKLYLGYKKPYEPVFSVVRVTSLRLLLSAVNVIKDYTFKPLSVPKAILSFVPHDPIELQHSPETSKTSGISQINVMTVSSIEIKDMKDSVLQHTSGTSTSSRMSQKGVITFSTNRKDIKNNVLLGVKHEPTNKQMVASKKIRTSELKCSDSSTPVITDDKSVKKICSKTKILSKKKFKVKNETKTDSKTYKKITCVKKKANNELEHSESSVAFTMKEKKNIIAQKKRKRSVKKKLPVNKEKQLQSEDDTLQSNETAKIKKNLAFINKEKNDIKVLSSSPNEKQEKSLREKKKISLKSKKIKVSKNKVDDKNEILGPVQPKYSDPKENSGFKQTFSDNTKHFTSSSTSLLTDKRTVKKLCSRNKRILRMKQLEFKKEMPRLAKKKLAVLKKSKRKGKTNIPKSTSSLTSLKSEGQNVNKVKHKVINDKLIKQENILLLQQDPTNFKQILGIDSLSIPGKITEIPLLRTEETVKKSLPSKYTSYKRCKRIDSEESAKYEEFEQEKLETREESTEEFSGVETKDSSDILKKNETDVVMRPTLNKHGLRKRVMAWFQKLKFAKSLPSKYTSYKRCKRIDSEESAKYEEFEQEKLETREESTEEFSGVYDMSPREHDFKNENVEHIFTQIQMLEKGETNFNKIMSPEAVQRFKEEQEAKKAAESSNGDEREEIIALKRTLLKAKLKKYDSESISDSFIEEEEIDFEKNKAALQATIDNLVEGILRPNYKQSIIKIDEESPSKKSGYIVNKKVNGVQRESTYSEEERKMNMEEENMKVGDKEEEKSDHEDLENIVLKRTPTDGLSPLAKELYEIRDIVEYYIKSNEEPLDWHAMIDGGI